MKPVFYGPITHATYNAGRLHFLKWELWCAFSPDLSTQNMCANVAISTSAAITSRHVDSLDSGSALLSGRLRFLTGAIGGDIHHPFLKHIDYFRAAAPFNVNSSKSTLNVRRECPQALPSIQQVLI
jgi:hypothetical protein